MSNPIRVFYTKHRIAILQALVYSSFILLVFAHVRYFFSSRHELIRSASPDKQFTIIVAEDEGGLMYDPPTIFIYYKYPGFHRKKLLVSERILTDHGVRLVCSLTWNQATAYLDVASISDPVLKRYKIRRTKSGRVICQELPVTRPPLKEEDQ